MGASQVELDGVGSWERDYPSTLEHRANAHEPGTTMNYEQHLSSNRFLANDSVDASIVGDADAVMAR